MAWHDTPTVRQSWVAGKWRAGIGWGVSASWVGLRRSASKDWSWISAVLERDNKWERGNKGRERLLLYVSVATRERGWALERAPFFLLSCFPAAPAWCWERCEHALPGQQWLAGGQPRKPSEPVGPCQNCQDCWSCQNQFIHVGQKTSKTKVPSAPAHLVCETLCNPRFVPWLHLDLQPFEIRWERKVF